MLCKEISYNCKIIIVKLLLFTIGYNLKTCEIVLNHIFIFVCVNLIIFLQNIIKL